MIEGSRPAWGCARAASRARGSRARGRLSAQRRQALHQITCRPHHLSRNHKRFTVLRLSPALRQPRLPRQRFTSRGLQGNFLFGLRFAGSAWGDQELTRRARKRCPAGPKPSSIPSNRTRKGPGRPPASPIRAETAAWLEQKMVLRIVIIAECLASFAAAFPGSPSPIMIRSGTMDAQSHADNLQVPDDAPVLGDCFRRLPAHDVCKITAPTTCLLRLHDTA